MNSSATIPLPRALCRSPGLTGCHTAPVLRSAIRALLVFAGCRAEEQGRTCGAGGASLQRYDVLNDTVALVYNDNGI